MKKSVVRRRQEGSHAVAFNGHHQDAIGSCAADYARSVEGSNKSRRCSRTRLLVALSTYAGTH